MSDPADQIRRDFIEKLVDQLIEEEETRRDREEAWSRADLRMILEAFRPKP